MLYGNTKTGHTKEPPVNQTAPADMGSVLFSFWALTVLGEKRKLVAKILKISKDHAKMQISGSSFKTDLATWGRPTSQHDVSKHLKLRIR